HAVRARAVGRGVAVLAGAAVGAARPAAVDVGLPRVLHPVPAGGADAGVVLAIVVGAAVVDDVAGHAGARLRPGGITADLPVVGGARREAVGEARRRRPVGAAVGDARVGARRVVGVVRDRGPHPGAVADNLLAGARHLEA